SDDIPPHLEREHYYDQMSCPTPGSNILNGTKAGGLMHEKTDGSFEEFVKQQFNN
ncbi:4627_t:CDS:1, partial [Funneliformis geosporum]